MAVVRSGRPAVTHFHVVERFPDSHLARGLDRDWPHASDSGPSGIHRPPNRRRSSLRESASDRPPARTPVSPCQCACVSRPDGSPAALSRRMPEDDEPVVAKDVEIWSQVLRATRLRSGTSDLGPSTSSDSRAVLARPWRPSSRHARCGRGSLPGTSADRRRRAFRGQGRVMSSRSARRPCHDARRAACTCTVDHSGMSSPKTVMDAGALPPIARSRSWSSHSG